MHGSVKIWAGHAGLAVLLWAQCMCSGAAVGMSHQRSMLQNVPAPAVRGSGSLYALDLMAAYNRNMSAYDMVSNSTPAYAATTFTYDASGDMPGQDHFVDRAYDYVITDVPLNASQISFLNRTIMQIPFAVSTIMIAHNIPGVGIKDLRLDAPALAGIFQCNITSWDDRIIKALNPSLRLPAAPIHVLARADRSSSTFILSSYLDLVADEWVMGVGLTLDWSPCVHQTESVISLMAALNGTAHAIAPVEHALARLELQPHARVENLAGRFVLPGLGNQTDYGLDPNLPDTTLSPDWIDAVLGNTTDPHSYPLSGLTYFILNQNSRYMGYPASILLRNMAFNLLTPLMQDLLPKYHYGRVPTQLLALRDESSLMLVNRAPNDTDTAGPSPQAQPALASSEIVAVKAAAGAGTPASQSSDGRPVIIGCAVGGAVTAALLAAAAALLITRRRRRRLLAAATALEVSPDKPSLRSLHAFPVDGPPKALTGGSAGSGIGGRGDFKSTIDGSYVQFERTASGELCLLGQGKFGKVFKARYLKKLVAIKVLMDDSPEQQQAFLAEALLLRDLRHPHIVQYLGHIQMDGKMLLVLEFMQGGNLAAAIAADNERGGVRRLAWKRHGLGIAIGIALGLHYLHSKRIIWFDCKSQNVLLDHTGMVAKLSDVGISKAMLNTHTQAFMKGTPGYIAPELVPQLCGTGADDADGDAADAAAAGATENGAAATAGGGGGGGGLSAASAPTAGVTFAVDIYSFGIVLWEVITGESAQTSGGRLRLPRVPEECSAEAVQLYQRCISRRPSERPNIAEVLQVLYDDQKALAA